MDMQPQPIPGYRIVRELGRGGMGLVYLAIRTTDGIPAALKTTMPAADTSDTEIRRFLREAEILGKLRHPHIVSFLEMGRANGRIFFAMEFVTGIDAYQLLKTEGPLAVPRAVNLICQVLEALEYAHGQTFVHRDIKPSNLLVTKVDGREWVKVTDFGLARVYQTSRMSGLTLMGERGGTYPFMAPEQITHFREVQPAGDQYAAAATLYNLLTDCYLFDVAGKIEQWLVKVLQEEPVPIRDRRPDVPKRLADVIHRALAKEPAKRFADVGTMRKALAKFGA
jgi:serine/threonine-protein kinase